MSAADFAIRGAELVDGTGAPRRRADLLVAGGRIAAIVAPGEGTATRSVEAAGLVLCPGFIDAHTHDDALVLTPRATNPKLLQGVTTVVTGNCGISLAPTPPVAPPPLDVLGEHAGAAYVDFAAWLTAVDQARPSLNVVPLVGHTTLRLRHVPELTRAAHAGECDRMAAEVRRALAAGAFGLSTGVFYPPARAATRAELDAVAAPLRTVQGLLAMHIRDESDDIDAALDEALAVGAGAGARLVISHHKVVGHANHGRTRHTLATIEQAAVRQSVCLDCYPYAASSTMLEPDRAARIGHVLVAWSKPHPDAAGRTLQSLADGWGLGLREAAERLLPGGAIYFGMAEEDVERVLRHPLTMVGSDGLPHDASPHPRLWGTFPRVLGHYARGRGLFPLEAAVHKMTGLPAQRFGLADRGVLAPGHAADLVLFDPERIADAANYEAPTRPPRGIAAVWVNGQLAVEAGEQRARHAGSRLRPAHAEAA